MYFAVRFLSKSQILGASFGEDQHPSKSVLDVLKEMSRKRIYTQVTIHILSICHKCIKVFGIGSVFKNRINCVVSGT